MTAPLPPNADELVSAYLDGEAAPDEITFVENSPELMARVEAMRSVTQALAAPVTPPAAEVREAHLGAALGTFDELLAAGEFDQPALTVVEPVEQPPTPTADPTVTSLAAARERRRPRRLSVVAAAAAAVALLFVGIVAVGLNAGDSRDVVDAPSEAVAVDSAADATEARDAGAATESFAAEEAAPEAAALAPEDAELEAADEALADEAPAAEAAPAPTPPPPPAAAGAADDAADDAVDDDAEQDFAAEPEADAVEEEAASDGVTVRATSDLGTFVNLEDLGVELEDWLRASTAIEELQAIDPDEVPSVCAAEVRELLGVETASLLAVATVEGRLVEVHAVDSSTVVVIDAEECRPLLDVNV